MKCPQGCASSLVIAERMGVEIDYCPDCRGVWLDRGELDKILERAEKEFAPAPAPPAPPQAPQGYAPPISSQPVQQRPEEYRKYDDDYRKYNDDYRKYDDDYYKKKKKKSLLGELFDF